MTPIVNRSAGVFETVLMRQGALVDRLPHLRRLARSLEALFGMPLPPELDDELDNLPSLSQARVRISVWPRAGCLAWEVESEPLQLDAPLSALTLVPLTVDGGLGCHKWSDRSWLTEQRRARVPIPNAELLLLDCDGEVLETERAAVLLVENDRLVAAPDDERRLPSVTRRRLLSAATDGGWQVVVQRIDLDRLLSADLVLTASSIRLIAPVGRCASRTWPENRVRDQLVFALRESLALPTPDSQQGDLW